MPGHHRHDRVDTAVDARRGELDAAAVAPAGHADAWIAGLVEPHLWLLGHTVDQGAHIAPLNLWRVDVHLTARYAETARVPGEHVVAEIVQALDRTAGRVAFARSAPTGSVEDHGRALARRQRGIREPVGDDRRAVERRDHKVLRLSHTGGGRPREQATPMTTSLLIA